jgi:uncharacterized OsmC-like protein
LYPIPLALLLLALLLASSCTHKANIAVTPDIDPRISIYANDDYQPKLNLPTLRDHLLTRRDALLQLHALPVDQLKPLVLQARTTAEQRAGIRRIRIRNFQIESDSGHDYAGYNIGPSSPESAQAVLASDIANTYLNYAALHGIPLDSLEVTIGSSRSFPVDTSNTATPDTSRVYYPRNLVYTLYVVSPATDEQLESLRLEVETHSPLFNLVSKPQIITGDIDYTQTPTELKIPDGYQPGLREYLKYKRKAYLYKQEQRSQGGDAFPAEPRITAHIKVEGATGVRRAHIREFEILHDNPPYLAGHDLGPSAQEHQLGVLTSCITHITLIQAAAREIPLDTLEVSVKGTVDYRAGRKGFENTAAFLHDISYTIHVKAPVTYEKIVELRNAVEDVCPIYNLLKNQQVIKGKIVRGKYN